ncbi:MAG: hypothetical protein DWQ47_16060 [Acidobacteria bacterium]|nr:MAG: hypothetical protein DWQ32_03460 [Acidobacteriota bacterium]REK02431.1 MAG: hypothetical protein DWQ38_08675 [Acidobacteriota bacterium]REK13768.1 MAG: hypothetical protein DWQ43_09150 [Acidobacteriota bacterium]REK41762.1 MAG: hypothetical protein DWQ47_16060 [Acidobacteriota bacterium]
MKKFLIVLVVVLASTALAYGQGGSTPYPDPTPDRLNPERGAGQAMRQADELNRRSDALRMTQNLPPSVPDKRRQEFLDNIRPFYRESTDEEWQFLSPSEEDKEAYKTAAKGKDAGLIVLVEDKGCATNSQIVDASPECKGLTMPGAGSGFSFRMKDYRMHHIADIVFKDGQIQALGVLNHGIMVDLGDVAIEGVDEKTEGVGYLAKIKASKDFKQAADLANKLTKGIEKDGRRYASILTAKTGSTYVLRSIAYEGESLKKVGGVIFNELELDKRRDVLVAFRIVRLENGRATILWREIDDDKSPELKVKKDK